MSKGVLASWNTAFESWPSILHSKYAHGSVNATPVDASPYNVSFSRRFSGISSRNSLLYKLYIMEFKMSRFRKSQFLEYAHILQNQVNLSIGWRSQHLIGCVK